MFLRERRYIYLETLIYVFLIFVASMRSRFDLGSIMGTLVYVHLARWATLCKSENIDKVLQKYTLVFLWGPSENIPKILPGRPPAIQNRQKILPQ